MSWLDDVFKQIPGVTFSGTPAIGDTIIASSPTEAAWGATLAPLGINITDAASLAPRTVIGSLTGGAAGMQLIALAKTAAAASQSGRRVTIATSDAVAGTSINSAAGGGRFSFIAGSAAHHVSGDANGGGFTFTVGNGVGFGVPGGFSVVKIDLTILFSIDGSGNVYALGDMVSSGQINGSSIVTSGDITADGQLTANAITTNGALDVQGNASLENDASVGGELDVSGAIIFSGTATLRCGAGSPNGVVNAAVGSIYTDLNGGLLTTLYVKTSGGSGNTGWTAK